MKQYLYLLVGLICGLSSPLAHGQIAIDTSGYVNETLSDLFGAGLTISNVTFSCDTTLAIGTFDNGGPVIGLDSGVVISTGSVISIADSNVSPAVTTALNRPGDPDLDSLVMLLSYDACVIEFDAISVCDTIQINYVFGSDEYHEFVTSFFNDVFAFFISGPGYSSPTNFTQIPGTSLPVTINNLNNGFAPGSVPSSGPCTNCAFFVDNFGGTGIEFDGFTVPLTAYASVIPGSTYHFKLAIADVSDNILDSGVMFLKRGICANTGARILQVFDSANQSVTSLSLAEGNSTQLNVVRALPPSVDETVRLGLSGTATMGIDYVMADSIVLPAGQLEASLPISLLPDCELEGTETLVIHLLDSTINCAGGVFSDSIVIFLEDLSMPILPALDSAIGFCSGESVSIGGVADPNTSYQWFPTLGLSDSLASLSTLSLQQDTSLSEVLTYTLTATKSNCTVSDSLQVEIRAVPELSPLDLPTEACSGDSISFGSSATLSTQLAWNFGDGQSSSEDSVIYAYTIPADSSYQVTLTASNGTCVATDSQRIEIFGQPVIESWDIPSQVCSGDTISFFSTSSLATQWTWTFGDGQVGTSDSVFHTYLATADSTYQIGLEVANGACVDRDSGSVEVYIPPSLLEVQFSEDSICAGKLTMVSAVTTGADTFTWNLPSGGLFFDPQFTYIFPFDGKFYLGLTMGNPACEIFEEIEVDVIACAQVGIDHKWHNDIKVFPNPAKDELHIQMPENTRAEAKLYDVSGRSQQEVSLSGEGTMPVAQLAAGWYILEISTQAGTFQQRIQIH